jgi:3-oxoacyl-[acyl-carrier-protein] synthase II
VSPGDPIVITGAGTIGAHGDGLASLRERIERGVPAVSEIDTGEGFHPARTPRAVLAVDPAHWKRRVPALAARRMSQPSRFAVAAADAAMEAAGLAVPEAVDPATAIVIATAFGPSSYTQRLVDQILFEGPQAASPALFTECVANAPAAQISIRMRASGPNLTVVEREAGPLIAVGRAAAEIAGGRADRVLAGSVEEMTPLLHASLARFGALATPEADGVERARPFDARRSGFLAAEGATVVVLEREHAARARGATPLARIVGWTAAFDPSASQVGWGHGADRLGRSLSRMLDRSGRTVADIDRIVSGASGSRAGDRIEARTLRAVWGERPLPPVTAPKGVVGEYGGGFLAAALLALDDASPTAGFERPDPDLGLSPVTAPGGGPARRVLVSTIASGGPACWLLLERP